MKLAARIFLLTFLLTQAKNPSITSSIFAETEGEITNLNEAEFVSKVLSDFELYNHTKCGFPKANFEIFCTALHNRASEPMSLIANKTGRIRITNPLYSIQMDSLYKDIYSESVRANLFNMLSKGIIPFIYGGLEVTEDRVKKNPEYSNCVAVGNKNQKFAGSGVLLQSNVVLTAAHCITEGFDEFVCVGYDLKDKLIYRVKNSIIHDNYRKKGKPDIGILILDKKVDNFRKIELAKKAELQDAKYVRVVGFGTTDVAGTEGYGKKREAYVPMFIPEKESNEVVWDKENEFVAVSPRLDVDSCAGDSGGPAFVEVNGQLKLAGIVSRALIPNGENRNNCGLGGIYVRVDKFEQWINDIQTAEKEEN